MTQHQENLVLAAFSELIKVCHASALKKGWKHPASKDAEKIALIHSELSEALEGLRTGDGPSDHIPEFRCSEEEFADVIIRLAHFAGARGQRLGPAIIAKLAFNETRPHKHGKKF